MSQRPFNVLQAPPRADLPSRLPWPVILATLVFLLVMGRQLESWRQQLALLRYDAAVGADLRSMPSPDAEPDAPLAHALTAELTYPWDNVLNLLGEADPSVRWTQLEGSADGSALHLQVQAPDAKTFWTWLNVLRKNAANATATATQAQAENGLVVFEVSVTWRRAP